MEIDGREDDLSYKWFKSCFTHEFNKIRVKNDKKTRLPKQMQSKYILFFYYNPIDDSLSTDISNLHLNPKNRLLPST